MRVHTEETHRRYAAHRLALWALDPYTALRIWATGLDEVRFPRDFRLPLEGEDFEE